MSRKRAKRTVENAPYAAMLRRMLRSYARRVAAGDVEALRDLVLLPAEVDAMVRTAVAGLRECGYSWSEIADRLGVTKQAAQMRYGHSDERGGIDRRVLRAGLSVTVPILVDVFADHYPGSPPAAACPYCGYRYPDKVRDCPTNATVRPLLVRRRHEDWQAFTRLTEDQRVDLLGTGAKKSTRPAPAAVPVRAAVTSSLFDTDPLVRKAGLR
jgi:hypothetical protein